MTNISPDRIRLGSFRVDLSSGELSGEQGTVRLQEKSFRLLQLLVHNPGRVVTREEIEKRLWPDDTIVDFEHGINAAIKKLRQALGDSAEHPRYIETIPRRGYRLLVSAEPVAPLSPVLSSSAELPVYSGPATTAVAPVPPRFSLRWLVVAALLILTIGATSFAYRRRAAGVSPKNSAATRHTIVLADFTSSGANGALASALKQMVAARLQQSNSFTVLSDARVQKTLKLLNVSSVSSLAETQARDVCVRSNSKAYVVGELASSAGHYVFTLAAEDCTTGEARVTTSIEADSPDRLLRRAGEQSEQFSQRLAERLAASPSAAPPLPEEVTGSLEAVQALVQGDRVGAAGGDPTESLQYYQRAVELDPNFAMGYYSLAMSNLRLGNIDIATEDLNKAYALRTRVTPREQAMVDATYSLYVAGDAERAASAYREWARLDPDIAEPHARLGRILNTLGQYEAAAAEAKQAIAISKRTGGNMVGHGVLISAYLHQGKLNEARAAFEDAQAYGQENRFLWLAYQVAFAQGDGASMDRFFQRTMGGGNQESVMFFQASQTQQYFGHFRKARELLAQSTQAARHFATENAYIYQSASAVGEAEAGYSAHARQSLPPVPWGKMWFDTPTAVAYTLARIGDIAQAQRLAARIDQEYPANTEVQRCWLPVIRAEIALQKSDSAGALRELLPALPHEAANLEPTCQMLPAYVRGRAYLAAGDPQAAIAEFQNIVQHPAAVLNSVVGSLSILQLARAQSAMGDEAAAKQSYERFLALWSEADPDIPAYRQAKAEYARLNNPRVAGTQVAVNSRR